LKSKLLAEFMGCLKSEIKKMDALI